MPSGGFWRKPVTRMYSYNLDLGEHYYSPMTSYLEPERGTRGETPGALTFSERLARKWVNGRRYEATELRDRYARSSSMAREASQAAATVAKEAETATATRSARAVSEMPARGSFTSAWLNRRAMQEQASASSAKAQTEQKSVRMESTQQRSSQQQSSSTTIKSTKNVEDCECGCEESLAWKSGNSKTARMALDKMNAQRQAFLSGYSSQTQQKAVRSREEEVKIKVSEKQSDDVNKKIADIHMHPWMNRTEMQEADEASARARARILELERELEEITKKALMTSSKSLKTAKQMAYQASMEADEEAKAASTKRSKKVIMQSSTQIRG